MKRILLLLIFLILVLITGYALYIQSIPEPVESLRAVTLFYYNPERDRDEAGNVMCSRKGLEGVQREIPRTMNPVKDTLALLLRGELLDEERERGITTEYPLEGVSLKNAVLDNGVLILTFDDPGFKTGGGACRVGILWFQIEATAKQFEGVQEMRFYPEELFQP